MRKPFIIKGWLAQPDLNAFVRGDRTVRVEPKVMDLCVRLAESPGTVVSKGELLDAVWPDTTVGEDALTRAVSELRRALEDDSRTQQVIETIPKRGYRLIAPVETADASPATGQPRGGGVVFAAVLISVIMAASAWIWRNDRHQPAANVERSRPLLLLAPFENGTGNSNLEQLVRRSIERQLLRTERVAFATKHRVDGGLGRMRRGADGLTDVDTALELAQRDGGIAAVITGRIDHIGNGYVVAARVTERSGAVFHTFIAEGRSEQMLVAAAAREASLLGNTLHQLRSDAAKPLPAVTTSSYTALQLFTRAVEDTPPTASSSERATSIELLQKALALDNEFVVARVWLAMKLKTADVSRVSDRDGVLGPAEAYRSHAREALKHIHLLSKAEQLFVEGAASTLLEQDDKAIAAFEALLWSTNGFFERQTRVVLASLYARQARHAEYAEQMVRLADLAPGDFRRTLDAAEALVVHDRDTRRAAPLIARARQLLTPAVAQEAYFAAAWLELLPVYEQWTAGDIDGARSTLDTLGAQLRTRVGDERDAVGTALGYWWLAFGRPNEARRAFETVEHLGQRRWNLIAMADLLDDRRQATALLNGHGWAYNPVPFARAGLFRRANAIMQQPAIGGLNRPLHLCARGEEALAKGRYDDAISEFQQGLHLLRDRPVSTFYAAAMSLARAWQELGDRSQEILVLEEAARTRPVYSPPGIAAAWWVKAQTHLVHAYREGSRFAEADALERQIRKLLVHGEPGFLVPSRVVDPP